MASKKLLHTFNVLKEQQESVKESTNEDVCCLTLDDCDKIIKSAINKAEQLKTLMNIAIVDHTGNLISFAKMPGAWNGSIEIAKSKAYTAFSFSDNKDKQGPLTTEELGKLAQPGQPLFGIQNSNSDKGIIIFGGGIPLYKDNILVGAIGVSGSTVPNDIKVAEAGLAGI